LAIRPCFVVHEFSLSFHFQSIPIGWGMTELSPIGTMSGAKKIVYGSCGVLIPNTEAKIVDLKTGEALGPGMIGELCIRGPQVLLI
jgi:4-coumarate--CoA ligase